MDGEAPSAVTEVPPVEQIASEAPSAESGAPVVKEEAPGGEVDPSGKRSREDEGEAAGPEEGDKKAKLERSVHRAVCAVGVCARNCARCDERGLDVQIWCRVLSCSTSVRSDLCIEELPSAQDGRSFTQCVVTISCSLCWCRTCLLACCAPFCQMPCG